MSGSEEGENRSRRDRQDKNEARRAGDWEMVLSTSKSTGDWFGSSGGRRQVSESIIKNGKGCTVQICVELRVVELIEWIGQVQRQSRGKKKNSQSDRREERRPVCLRWCKHDRRAFTAWRQECG